MLDRLEKKLGKYAVKNPIYYILGAYAIGYILYIIDIRWYDAIVLYPSLVMKGQVWRLFTWVCTIPQPLSILTIFMFLFYFFIGRSLEQYLGAFKYNLYIFSGWFITTVGVMAVYWITGAINGAAGATTISASTNYLNLTSFLAFAVIFPETKVLFFGIIPVKMKILAWIDAAYLGLQVISGIIVAVAPLETLNRALQSYYGYPPDSLEIYVLRESSISLMVTILISMLNFLIFFAATAKTRADSTKRRRDFERKAGQGRQQFYESGRYTGSAEGTGSAASSGTVSFRDSEISKKKSFSPGPQDGIVHRCSICGKTNIEYPDMMFRYCSRCSGEHEYCQEHLFTHEHIK